MLANDYIMSELKFRRKIEVYNVLIFRGAGAWAAYLTRVHPSTVTYHHITIVYTP